MKKKNIPHELKIETYFNFSKYPFMHQSLFQRWDVEYVYDVIRSIHEYAEEWLAENIKKEVDSKSVLVYGDKVPGVPCAGGFEVIVSKGAFFHPEKIIGRRNGTGGKIFVADGAIIEGGYYWLESGSIYIGTETRIEPGSAVKGPVIIGESNTILHGAKLRNNVITGDGCVIGGEVKNCVIMDQAMLPHHCYVGDSLCGYKSHFGSQATAANYSIFGGLGDSEQTESIKVQCGKKTYDLGITKMGLCLGDFCQLGCGVVSDPATFLAPRTVVYPLTRIPRGFYGPDEILKNKPLMKGVILREPLRK